MPSPTEKDPMFDREPDDPPGTIRRTVRSRASLDHYLGHLTSIRPEPDRSLRPGPDRTVPPATPYPGPRQERTKPGAPARMPRERN